MFFQKKHLVVPLLCITTVFIFARCRQSNEEQIKDTAIAFLEAMNERDYSLMTELSTPQSETFIKYAESNADNLTRFKTIKATDVRIEGNLAEISVEVVDIYGNISTWSVPFVKTDHLWKADLSNQPDAEEIHPRELPSVITEDSSSATESKITPR